MNGKKAKGRVYSELLKIRHSINKIKKQAGTAAKNMPKSGESARINRRLYDEVIEREKALMELNLSRELFFKIFHCSPLLMCITRLRDFRYIDVNEAFLKVVLLMI